MALSTTGKAKLLGTSLYAVINKPRIELISETWRRFCNIFSTKIVLFTNINYFKHLTLINPLGSHDALEHHFTYIPEKSTCGGHFKFRLERVDISFPITDLGR